MKKLQWFVSIVLSLAVIVIVFFTSFQMAMYADFGFYERMYEKHNVLPDLNMEMEDVMYVTREMMAYLRGDREELSVITLVDGEIQDFFGDRERFHMEKVQGMFLGGLTIRTISIVVLLLCLLVLFLTKADWKRLLPRAYQITVAVTAALSVVFGIAAALNFSWVFDVFHEIFFEDECWLFDPAYSYMIRMLPEDFFFDMTMRIGIFFVSGIVLLLIASIVARLLIRKSNKQV